MLLNCANSAARLVPRMHTPQRFLADRAAMNAFPVPRPLVPKPLIAAAVDLDIHVADLLAEGIAVEAEQDGSAALVAPGRGQGRREQRHLDFLQDPVLEPRRRVAVGQAWSVPCLPDLDLAAE